MMDDLDELKEKDFSGPAVGLLVCGRRCGLGKAALKRTPEMMSVQNGGRAGNASNNR